jgi:hypothetical protein
VKQPLPWTRKIARAIYLGLSVVWTVPSLLILALDADSRALLVKHDWSNHLFRLYAAALAAPLGMAVGFAVLVFLVGKPGNLALTVTVIANVGMFLTAGFADALDFIFVTALSASLLCLLFEGWKTVISFRKQAT